MLLSEQSFIYQSTNPPKAIITTLGPELSVYDASVVNARNNILIASSILQSGQPLLQVTNILLCSISISHTFPDLLTNVTIWSESNILFCTCSLNQ